MCQVEHEELPFVEEDDHHPALFIIVKDVDVKKVNFQPRTLTRV
nr:unnamed protein product [Callosobruchus analis]